MTTIILDWKQTLYNPETEQLVSGAADFLAFLQQQDVRIVLIGKGSQDMHQEVERLQVKDYFDEIIFSDEPKDVAQFAPFVDSNNPIDTYVIGDRIKGEISVGNTLGATTIWVQQGKFASETPQDDTEKPAYTVSSLPEVKTILENLL